MKNQLAAILLLAELMGSNTKEQNDLKAVGIKAATNGAVELPEDWESLHEEEKKSRLDKTYDILQRGGNE